MSQTYLCPVCRAPMERELNGRLPFIRHVQMTLLTILISALAYLTMGPGVALKAAVLYLPLWALFEFLHWIQLRETLKCTACDFDPMLYQRDWKKARSQVEGRMTKIHDGLEAEIAARIQGLKRPGPNQSAADSSLTKINGPDSKISEPAATKATSLDSLSRNN